jgi:hydrogenase nickel incorporation protein HypA/HybF
VHELSLTQSLVEIAETHARRAGASAIRTITLEVGELCGVVPEALEFAFDVCRPGTLAEGARLIIRRIAGHGRCAACQAQLELSMLSAACPACGALAMEIEAGSELRIVELEID